MTWKTIPSLFRVNLSLIVSCSTLTGFVCCRHAITPDALAVFLGIFFLACAASTLNQYQEREFDALMDRTRKRPLPMRQVGGRSVLVITALTGCAGVSVLYFGSSPLAALMGIATLLWYNGVYTPLKRKTRFAVLIGALTGALPPLIGFTAAGGPIMSSFLTFSLFMFLWQVSHVQVLLVRYGREYEGAGFPAMVSSTNEKGVRISALAWTTATVVSACAFPAVRVVSGILPSLMLTAGSGLFLAYFFYAVLMRGDQSPAFTRQFGSVYVYQGFVFLLIIGSSVLIRQ